MVLAIALIIFVIGCCMDSFEEASYQSRKEAQRRHKELMDTLSREKDKVPSVRKVKVTRRRIAKDSKGNILAEEITEEEL